MRIIGTMEYTQKEIEALILVAGIIAFTVVAIVAFIYTGGGILFYIIAIVTLLLDAYMAYRIWIEEKAEKSGQKAKSKK